MVKVRLYDPHPGFGGAAVPLPSRIKQLADSLNHKTLTLEETIARVKEVAEPIFGESYKVDVCEEYNFIGFSLKTRSGTDHYFRLLRYEEVDDYGKVDKIAKEKRLERVKNKRLKEEKKHREETEKIVRKILNNYETPKSIDELPIFTGWTPSYTLEYFEFKLEYDINLINIGKQVSKNVKRVTAKELEYGKQHAGSKELFEQKRLEIQKAFDDLNQRGLEFVGYRTYRGWPAVWDAVEFYSKPEKWRDKNA